MLEQNELTYIAVTCFTEGFVSAVVLILVAVVLNHRTRSLHPRLDFWMWLERVAYRNRMAAVTRIKTDSEAKSHKPVYVREVLGPRGEKIDISVHGDLTDSQRLDDPINPMLP